MLPFQVFICDSFQFLSNTGDWTIFPEKKNLLLYFLPQQVTLSITMDNTEHWFFISIVYFYLVFICEFITFGI